MKIEKYKKWANDGDNEFRPFVNYTVTKKSDKTEKVKKMLFILMYVVFDLAYSVIFLTVIKIPMLIALVPVLTWIMVHFTWCFTKVEYEYKIVSGMMTVRISYGELFAKSLCEFKLAEALMLASMETSDKALFETIPEDKKYYCVSSRNAENIYVAVFEKSGEKCAIYFELTDKVLKVIKSYVSNIVK